MDEHVEHVADTTAGAVSRREMLQRTGFVVGAAALWATPIVQTVGMRPAAATTDTDACPDGGMPLSLTWRYVPSACNVAVLEPGNDVVLRSGCCDLTGNPGRVKIEFWRNDSQASGEDPEWSTEVGPNETFTPPALYANGKVGPNNSFRIMPVDDPDCVQRFRVHTSCSQPLNVGDRFLSIQLVGFTPG